MELHYVLNFWEPAVPSFCSFAKPYVGDKQAILGSCLTVRIDPRISLRHPYNIYFNRCRIRLGLSCSAVFTFYTHSYYSSHFIHIHIGFCHCYAYNNLYSYIDIKRGIVAFFFYAHKVGYFMRYRIVLEGYVDRGLRLPGKNRFSENPERLPVSDGKGARVLAGSAEKRRRRLEAEAGGTSESA